jgi:hypothetical protein
MELDMQILMEEEKTVEEINEILEDVPEEKEEV